MTPPPPARRSPPPPARRGRTAPAPAPTVAPPPSEVTTEALVHQRIEVRMGGGYVLTRCGLEGHRRGLRGTDYIRLHGQPLDVSAWPTEVTCDACRHYGLLPGPDRPGPIRLHDPDCDCWTNWKAYKAAGQPPARKKSRKSA